MALKLAMSEIGQAAAAGRPVTPATLDRVAAAAARAPLAPEPFLVRGITAQLAGDLVTAEQAFSAARSRDPRSLAARYFLAELYRRTGRMGAALEETSVLAGLAPTGSRELAPFLAEFARSPHSVPRLRKLFRMQPQLLRPVLATLSSDPRNADLVLALAGVDELRSPAYPGDWKSRLVAALVEQGDYARAQRMWATFAAVPSNPGVLLFNPGFSDSKAPPPFNWALEAGAAGLAEPSGQNGLRVIFYGRDDAVLASQLLRLAPGTYRLAMTVAGGHSNAGSLAWTVTCLPAKKVIATVPLAPAKRIAGMIPVPAGGCPAQLLQLAGTASEFPQQAEVVISGLSLSRGDAR